MATDIKISELNEITANDDINYIIVNDRENAGDEGITKKITLENFLTPNIVQETNILNNAVTNDKIQDLAVDCSKIASNTITCNQILGCTINNPSLDSNSVDNRVLNNNCNFTVKGLLVNDGCVNISNPATGSLNVVSGVTRLNGLNYNWPSSQVADKFLKTDGAGNLTWQEAVPGESTALVFAEIMPVGTIIPWGGIGNTPDDKWLPCDGGTFNGPTYPELSAAIGENFGARVSDTFKLPDMRGRVPLGEAEAPGSSDGTDTCTFLLGVKGGKYNHTLSIGQLPNATGNFKTTRALITEATGVLSIAGNAGGTGNTTAGGDPGTSVNFNLGGGNQSHNSIQPYTVTRYIIKARPDDIEQFNPAITPGLSAKNASGQQANITLNTTEIGLKVSDDFEFDTGGKLEVSTAWVNINIDQGKPIQYVNNHINTTHRYTKTADVDLHITQLDTAATLKNTSSKVYITAMITAESYTHNGVWKLFRKVGITETEIGSNITAGVNNRKGIAAGMHSGDDSSTPENIYIQYMDAPNASSVTYLFKWNSDGTGANYFTLNGSRSTNNSESYEMASSNVNLVEIGG